MSSSSKKKKQSHLARNAFILLVVLLSIFALISAFSQLPPSSRVSISSSGLSASDFEIVGTTSLCGFANVTGLKWLVVNAQLENHKNIAFHFLSARIMIVNYTLADGTVVSAGEVKTDNTPTFGAAHAFSINVDTKVPKSGPKITNIQFMITVYIQEIPEPISLPFSMPPNC